MKHPQEYGDKSERSWPQMNTKLQRNPHFTLYTDWGSFGFCIYCTINRKAKNRRTKKKMKKKKNV